MNVWQKDREREYIAGDWLMGNKLINPTRAIWVKIKYNTNKNVHT